MRALPNKRAFEPPNAIFPQRLPARTMIMQVRMQPRTTRQFDATADDAFKAVYSLRLGSVPLFLVAVIISVAYNSITVYLSLIHSNRDCQAKTGASAGTRSCSPHEHPRQLFAGTFTIIYMASETAHQTKPPSSTVADLDTKQRR